MPSIKELYKRLDDVKIDADSINLNTDGLESLLATTQADIALIKADIANGVLSDVRDGSGNALTSSSRGSQRALSVQIVDNSGNQITSFGGTGPNIGSTGSATPLSASLVGGSDGSSLRGLSVDSNGKANVNISNVLDEYASGSLKAIAYGVNEEGDHPVQIPVGNHGYNYTHTYGVMLAYNGSSTQQVVGTSNGLPVQGTVTSKLQDGSGNAITSTVFGSARRLDVNLSSAGTVGSTAPTSANLYAGSDGTNLRAVSVDSSGRINTNINGTVPVSGTVTANTGLSQPLTDTQLRATAVPVSGSVTALSSTGTITTRSSTITTGGTSQQVAASNTSRKYFVIQNISDTAMYLGAGYTPTTTTGLLLSANGGGIVFETSFIPTQAINVLCATTGKAFVAWEG